MMNKEQLLLCIEKMNSGKNPKLATKILNKMFLNRKLNKNVNKKKLEHLVSIINKGELKNENK